MPLKLPWQAHDYLVCIIEGTRYQGDIMAREHLEELAAKGKKSLFDGVVDEFRRRFPGRFNHIDIDKVEFRLGDDREERVIWFHPLWTDD